MGASIRSDVPLIGMIQAHIITNLSDSSPNAAFQSITENHDWEKWGIRVKPFEDLIDLYFWVNWEFCHTETFDFGIRRLAQSQKCFVRTIVGHCDHLLGESDWDSCPELPFTGVIAFNSGFQSNRWTCFLWCLHQIEILFRPLLTTR
jgi:hypothetical protein